VAEQRGTSHRRQVVHASGGRLLLTEQLAHRGGESADEPFDDVQGQIAGVCTVLEPLDGQRVDADRRGEAALGQAAVGAQAAQRVRPP
jgi:hypothetical protein